MKITRKIQSATNTCGISAKPEVLTDVDEKVYSAHSSGSNSPEDYYEIADETVGFVEFELRGLPITLVVGSNGHIESIDFTGNINPKKFGVDYVVYCKYGEYEIDSDQIEEDLLDVIMNLDELPEKSGNYYVSGDVTLIYNISDVTIHGGYSEDVYYEGIQDDPYDYINGYSEDYDFSDARFSMDWRKSSVQDVKINKS